MKQLLLLFFLSLSLQADSLGSLLFHGNCITCHNEIKTISAPSILSVRENYIRAFPLKKDFLKYMSQWVIKPKEETSIMLDAIQKHELMPELGYDLSTLKIISAYIYDTDFTKEHQGHEKTK